MFSILLFANILVEIFEKHNYLRYVAIPYVKSCGLLNYNTILFISPATLKELASCSASLTPFMKIYNSCSVMGRWLQALTREDMTVKIWKNLLPKVKCYSKSNCISQLVFICLSQLESAYLHYFFNLFPC